jgi:hypothetical protein
MIETRTPVAQTPMARIPPVGAAVDLAQSPARDGTRGGRWRRRLWAILNAQALIRGTAGGPDDALMEDDRHRLARRGH